MAAGRTLFPGRLGIHVLVFFLLLDTLSADSSDFCVRAPTAATRVVCQQLRTWDASVRRVGLTSWVLVSEVPESPSSDLFHIETNREFSSPNRGAYARPSAHSPTPPERSLEDRNAFHRNASDPFQCMDLHCLCPFLNGTFSRSGDCVASDGSRIGRATRKEYRQMTDTERRRFHEALNRLKINGVFDRFVEAHADSEKSGGAHSGPAFLPWHREFLKRVEIALRLEDASVALPFWDSTMDEGLQRPEDSVLFSDAFVGASDARSGYVRDGPFSSWVTVEARRPIRRQPGVQGRLFMEADVDAVLAQTSAERVMAYTAPQSACARSVDWSCLEYTHGNVHVWVGGDMFTPSTAANDPLFLLHHAFVDLVWEQWRRRHQSARDRELQYPSTPDQDCANAEHASEAPMRPFAPLRNVDGLSNAYTEQLYEYAERPSCARTSADSECQSRYLFCDLSRGLRRCAPKLRDGAPCQEYGNRGCLSGYCNAGLCASTTRRTTVTTRNNSFANLYKSNRPKSTSCFNENECCAVWAAAGECPKNAEYMREWCAASCGLCLPKYDLGVGEFPGDDIDDRICS
ncbi:hypothetical protein QR680_014872 [Steinernema hermaphroditum]|uniref:ShKT domain-containing protein n=1 Tax=Steinernema hermaphroditum TaxID=289476 RepID=A0AA39ICK3_9BILA|nr:hypothetical protein QR680_014872 [Steinernema hermaphroditum]